MKLMRNAIAAALVLAMTAPLVGCGKKKPDGMPDLQPTTISLTVDGKGLANANVILQPEDAKANKWVPAGLTNANGVAEIETTGFKGAPEGSYKVVVSADEEVDYGEDGPPPKDDPAALEEWNRKANPDKWKRYSPVENQYTNAGTTPLTITIAAGKNAQDFDLGASAHDEVKQDKK